MGAQAHGQKPDPAMPMDIISERRWELGDKVLKHQHRMLLLLSFMSIHTINTGASLAATAEEEVAATRLRNLLT